MQCFSRKVRQPQELVSCDVFSGHLQVSESHHRSRSLPPTQSMPNITDHVYGNVKPPSRNHAKRPKRSNRDHELAVDISDAAATENYKSKTATISLGLLCLLLFAGLLALISIFTRSSWSWEAERALQQSLFNNLTEDNQRLQTSCHNLTEEMEQLHTKFKKLAESHGWKYFQGHFYLVSVGNKTWQESQEDCHQRGAELLIISNKEEQSFVHKFRKELWIGLTDLEQEGQWKWVDGTTVNKRVWPQGEPNGATTENCGSIKYFDTETGLNDANCSVPLPWICEVNMK
ncbi:CD209 antigen-like protein D [Nelusetta ayraudi]|uniref:CD209 antigen-like protein D n=1 Tax=Nelusetta ayraudi TaxID=303726 RepID=UPI003F71632B